MSTRRLKGAWWVDLRFKDQRIRRKSPVDTKAGAESYERQIRRELLEGTFEKKPDPPKKEVPTFDEWFTGRFWREWVVGRKNKPSEVEAKKSIYRYHLKPTFGEQPLDRIGVGEVAAFRASLVERNLSEKRINNVLAVLSKALNYAVDVELISRAPKVGLFRVERPEIEAWELDEYARILDSAREYGPEWFVAVGLAGEAGLRVGEVKALRWKEDVDLVGGTLTINRQMRQGVVGTPKGRTRRTVPLTGTLLAALQGLSGNRTGFVLHERDGSPKTDNQVRYALDEIYKRAGLPEQGWHILRHTFGTHAALFGVNPWRLQLWMGHKRIDETMRYVHLAEGHRRQLPERVLHAGQAETDPDLRILAMLGARGHLMGTGGGLRAKKKPVSDGLLWRPQRDLNPCHQRERLVS